MCLGIEVLRHDREAVFLVEDELGDVEELVSHLALAHRLAQHLELGVVRIELAGNGEAGRFRSLLAATAFLVSSIAPWSTRAVATWSTRSIATWATWAVATRAAITIIACATSAAAATAAGAHRLGGSGRPGWPESKGR
jgi:hypothetical protein